LAAREGNIFSLLGIEEEEERGQSKRERERNIWLSSNLN